MIFKTSWAAASGTSEGSTTYGGGGDTRMVLPARLTVYSFEYALDGGTTVLRGTDEAGREHEVTLGQHAFPHSTPSLGETPGRLYFDGALAPMRSSLEDEVLALLRAAEVRYSGPLTEHGERIQLSPNALILGEDIRQVLTRGPEENIRALLAEVIRFVESDGYLRFAELVEQASDPIHGVGGMDARHSQPDGRQARAGARNRDPGRTGTAGPRGTPRRRCVGSGGG